MLYGHFLDRLWLVFPALLPWRAGCAITVIA